MSAQVLDDPHPPPLDATAARFSQNQSMRRLLLNTLTVLSLLLFVAAAGLWVRGYWVSDSWKESGEGGDLTIWSEAGRVFVEQAGGERPLADSDLAGLPPRMREMVVRAHMSRRRLRERSISSRPADRASTVTEQLRQQAASDPATIRDWHLFGFHWFVSDGETEVTRSAPLEVSVITTSSIWQIGIPLWSVAVVFSLLPLAHARSTIRTRQQRRRQREGKCRACGYDLRASPERCPECGAAAPEPIAAGQPIA